MAINKCLSCALPVLLLTLFLSSGSVSCLTFTILHTGDIRGNFLPVSYPYGDTSCTPSYGLTGQNLTSYNSNCVGGWDSLTTYVNQVRANATNPVLLFDAGDTLSGTLFFPVFNSTMAGTYYTNLNYTAWNVGTRDWDGGGNVLSAFVNQLSAGGVVPVSTTLAFTGTGSLYSVIVTYVDLNITGTIVRVIGLENILVEAEAKLPTGVGLVSNPDSTALKTIGQDAKFVIVISKLGSLIDNTNMMNDLQGFADVVVGSMGGLYFWNNNVSCAADSNCIGPYPYVAGTPSAPTILVSPPDFGQGVGTLTVTFDDQGILTNWTGDVIWLNRTLIPPDPVVEEDLYNRNLVVDAFANIPIGYTPALLVGDGTQPISPCRWRECSMGNIIADAMRWASGTQIALMEGGSMRANISAGNITTGDMLLIMPFYNNIASFDITGTTLLAILNYAVEVVLNPTASLSGRFLQVSGLRFSWNPNLAPGSRVIDVQIFNNLTSSYEELDTTATYSCSTTNYMFLGGDNYNSVGLPSQTINALPYGALLTDVVSSYIQEVAWTPGIQGRIIATADTNVFQPTTPITVYPVSSIPSGLQIAFVVITGIFCAFPIILAGYFFTKREHAVVVIASHIFCQIIFFGVIIGYLAVFVYLLVLNDGGCMAFPWLGNYAFVIIFGALFAKTWRIDRIFTRTKKLKSKKPISNTTLFLIIGILIGIETFIMGLWQGLSPLKYILHLDVVHKEYLYTCSSTNGIYFFAASVAYKGVLMLWGMYLVVKTRNIESDFRESTFIGWVIYAVFLTCAVIVTICILLRTSVMTVYILIVIGFWIVLGAVVGALFAPKVIEIYQNPTLAWSTYFQRRADSMRGRSMVSSYTASSDVNESVEDKIEGRSLNELQDLLEEYKRKKNDAQKQVDSLESDMKKIESRIAKIAKKSTN